MACGCTTQRGLSHSSAGALKPRNIRPQQEEAEPVCRALSQAPNWLDLEDGTNTHVWFAREHLRMQLWEDRTKQDVWLRVSGYMSKAKRCGPKRHGHG